MHFQLTLSTVSNMTFENMRYTLKKFCRINKSSDAGPISVKSEPVSGDQVFCQTIMEVILGVTGDHLIIIQVVLDHKK